MITRTHTTTAMIMINIVSFSGAAVGNVAFLGASVLAKFVAVEVVFGDDVVDISITESRNK